VGTKESDEKVGLDEELGEFVPIPYTAVTKPPKKRYVPSLEIPKSIIDAEIEGRVEVTLTVGADGKVSDLAVVSGLHPDADAACLAALAKSRWKPGEKDGASVITKSVPYSCRFEAVN
jgi:TonB family protein